MLFFVTNNWSYCFLLCGIHQWKPVSQITQFKVLAAKTCMYLFVSCFLVSVLLETFWLFWNSVPRLSMTIKIWNINKKLNHGKVIRKQGKQKCARQPSERWNYLFQTLYIILLSAVTVRVMSLFPTTNRFSTCIILSSCLTWVHLSICLHAYFL